MKLHAIVKTRRTQNLICDEMSFKNTKKNNQNAGVYGKIQCSEANIIADSSERIKILDARIHLKTLQKFLLKKDISSKVFFFQKFQVQRKLESPCFRNKLSQFYLQIMKRMVQQKHIFRKVSRCIRDPK